MNSFKDFAIYLRKVFYFIWIHFLKFKVLVIVMHDVITERCYYTMWYEEAGWSTVQGRCIPIDIIDAKYLISTVVSGGFEVLISIIGNFTDDLKYREVAVFWDTEISRFFTLL